MMRTEGLVVEGDADHFLNGYSPLYLLPEYTNPMESTALDGVNISRRVLMQMAQGITLTETENVTSEALLVSSEHSYSKAAGYEMATAQQEDGDPDGPFALAAYAQLFGFNPVWWLCGCILLCGLVMTSRTILRRHTLWQVLAGTLLGVLCGYSGIRMM